MHKYPTNLTDKQWQVIKNMLDPKERFRKYSLRSVFDGILYIVKTGVQWRMLPSDFAPWQTVYYYFSKWKNEGLLEEIFDTLRGIVRRLSALSAVFRAGRRVPALGSSTQGVSGPPIILMVKEE